ncbi:MAG: LLM class flavin-dependent oxidoreductase [Candidatus Lambdaproteobacteria bacterium]|nr:LLM class flavin-dependent oxidoreductase [Candidatus Lambdaproteobacteria bacterium]
MDFGIVASKIDEIGYIVHAENLGFTHCWVSDSQMIRSNPWAVLALAAQQTRKIKLGPGVAVAGLRLAPVTANGIATINRLAPGRTFLSVGTGNTAMRMMGQPPMRAKPFGEYLRVVRALIRGEEVDYTLNGVTHPIRFQMREYNYVDVDHYIPLYVAGFGPRAQALAGELGDGLLTGMPRGGTIPEALAHAKAGAGRAGRSLEGFHTAALVNLVILEQGETLTSERVVAEVGAAIMANVHYLVDKVKESGMEPPAYVRPIWAEYLKFHMGRSEAVRHQKLHESHYAYLDPEEARFVTPELVRTFAVAGHPEEIVEQLRALEKQGLNQMLFIPPVEKMYRQIEDVARKVIAKM